jgi:hypothetical protein
VEEKNGTALHLMADLQRYSRIPEYWVPLYCTGFSAKQVALATPWHRGSCPACLARCMVSALDAEIWRPVRHSVRQVCLLSGNSTALAAE